MLLGLYRVGDCVMHLCPICNRRTINVLDDDDDDDDELVLGSRPATPSKSLHKLPGGQTDRHTDTHKQTRVKHNLLPLAEVINNNDFTSLVLIFCRDVEWYRHLTSV